MATATDEPPGSEGDLFDEAAPIDVDALIEEDESNDAAVAEDLEQPILEVGNEEIVETSSTVEDGDQERNREIELIAENLQTHSEASEGQSATAGSHEGSSRELVVVDTITIEDEGEDRPDELEPETANTNSNDSEAPERIPPPPVPASVSNQPAIIEPPRQSVSRKESEVKLAEPPEKRAKIEEKGQNVDEDDDGDICNICMEGWTNSGEHRISSLKCGHFFGLSCIDRWLKSGSNQGCPNCNEKANRRDIRSHFLTRLTAIDTSERDRALANLDKAQKDYRQLQLQHATLKVQNELQTKEIDNLRSQILKLRSMLNGETAILASLDAQPSSSLTSSNSQDSSAMDEANARLSCIKKLELIKPEVCAGERDRYCRFLLFNDSNAMLLVTQPSFTALAPGFGFRKISLLNYSKPGAFFSVHRESIR